MSDASHHEVLHYDLRGLPSGDRYKLLTGVVVPRPIAWVTSLNPQGTVNAAPFSYFGAMGSDPPIIAFAPGETKHTAANIGPGAEFVVNLVSFELAGAMNLTATDFPPGLSELDAAGLTAEPSHLVAVPRIAESPVALECREVQTLTIGRNRMVVGEVLMIHIRADLMHDPEKFYVNTPALGLIGRMGGRGGYARAQDTFELGRIPYAEWLREQEG